MSSKGKRNPETRGQYPRCKATPCKRKAERDGYCRLHSALAEIAAMQIGATQAVLVARRALVAGDNTTEHA